MDTEQGTIWGREPAMILALVQAVIALVVAKGQPEHQDLVAHCMAKLPAEKRPGAIAYTDALPRTSAGKVSRVKVRELALKAIQRAPAKRA